MSHTKPSEALGTGSIESLAPPLTSRTVTLLIDRIKKNVAESWYVAQAQMLELGHYSLDVGKGL